MLLLALLSCFEIRVDGCQDLSVGASITVTVPLDDSDDVDEDYTCEWRTYGHSAAIELEPCEDGKTVVVTAAERGAVTLEA